VVTVTDEDVELDFKDKSQPGEICTQEECDICGEYGRLVQGICGKYTCKRYVNAEERL
jgi:hypothetical protein